MLAVRRVAAVVAAVVAAGAAATPLCDVTDQGAVGDNSTLNTAAIVATTRSVVLVPAGSFVSGAFNLTSSLALRLGDGATLAASVDPVDFPLTQPRPTYCVCRGIGFSNLSTGPCRHQPFTGGWHLADVAIEVAGPSSIIDGRGYVWWSKRPPFAPELGNKYGMSKLIEPMYADHLRVQHLTLKDSPFWTLFPLASSSLYLADLTISAPNWYKLADRPPSGNTDGRDLDSCSDVLLERVHISVGDDAIVIKSGMDFCGREAALPSHNTLIRDTTFVTHHLATGSEMSGGVRNVTVDNCVFGDPDIFPLDGAGIFLKSHAGRGGVIEDIRFTNLQMLHVNQALCIDITSEFATNDTATSRFRKLLFENITANIASGCAGRMTSRHDQIENVTFRNFTVKSTGKCDDNSGWTCEGVKGTRSSAVSPPLGIGVGNLRL